MTETFIREGKLAVKFLWLWNFVQDDLDAFGCMSFDSSLISLLAARQHFYRGFRSNIVMEYEVPFCNRARKEYLKIGFDPTKYVTEKNSSLTKVCVCIALF